LVRVLAGLELAIARGWLWRHESGTYVKFSQLARICLPRDEEAANWGGLSNSDA
jgi:hypothetical protein